MKLLRFLCAFTLFLNHSLVIADEAVKHENTHTQEQIPQQLYIPTQFEHIELLINSLEQDILQETDTIKNFDFFQRQHNKIEQLYQKLLATYHKTIQSIENEKTDTEKQYNQRVSRAESDNTNELTQAQKNYNSLYLTHSKKLQNLNIDEQALAIENFRATVVPEFQATQIALQEKFAAKLEQLAAEHAHELEFIDIKKQALAEKYTHTADHYYAMTSIFDHEEEKALIRVQFEYVQKLEDREFDEFYTTATQPTLWSGIGSVMGSSPYTYRANKNGLECSGCANSDNYGMNTRLRKEMEDAQSQQAVQSLAMTLRALQKSQAEQGYDHEVGIQTCRLDGNNLRCKTIQDAYKKLLEENKQATQTQETEEAH